MRKTTQKELIQVLEETWEQYLDSYQQLIPEKQKAFLAEQGYASFHDLLAHICAWWEETLGIVNSILDNQEKPGREYDIDEFNAEAIGKFSHWEMADLEIHFENLRQALLDLAYNLPKGALEHHRIISWMSACVIEHAEEHKILE